MTIYKTLLEYRNFRFLPLCFFKKSDKLEFRICLIIPDVSLKVSPDFQNSEAAFERCSTKIVVQQNDWVNMARSVTQTSGQLF